MKILGAVQPSYLAWLPFFRRMVLSDVFVYLDDVEYSKNSFHNRNSIWTKTGALLLTVPVQYSGHSKDTIAKIPIAKNEKWAQKHLRSIEGNYSRAPFFNDLMPILTKAYRSEYQSLGDVNVRLLELFRGYFGIKTPCFRSSELSVAHLPGNEKLVALCRHFGADHFVVKPNTESYHPPSEFQPNGIEFTPFLNRDVPYPQLSTEYVPGLSALDLAMNCGPDGIEYLK